MPPPQLSFFTGGFKAPLATFPGSPESSRAPCLGPALQEGWKGRPGGGKTPAHLPEPAREIETPVARVLRIPPSFFPAGGRDSLPAAERNRSGGFLFLQGVEASARPQSPPRSSSAAGGRLARVLAAASRKARAP